MYQIFNSFFFSKENEHYLISYKEIDEILLHVKVDNKREVSEPSYGTIVNIKFDERLDFKKIEVLLFCLLKPSLIFNFTLIFRKRMPLL